MGLEHLIAFNLALMAAILSPGPAMLVAIQTSLTSGRLAGILCGIGLALMASMWTLLALLGLDAVFEIVPWGYAAVKFVGAAYLLYIAWSMWQGAKKDIRSESTLVPNAFFQGIMINALNPKSVLFAAAVLVVIFPAGMSASENTLIVLNHLVVEIIFYCGLAMVMSTGSVREKYLKAKFYLDRAASLVLGALGIRLLLSR